MEPSPGSSSGGALSPAALMADSTTSSFSSLSEQGNVSDMTQSEKRRSKTCLICGADAESYHLNYGAAACLSCRAFFRRSIQKDRDPKFVCKFGGSCTVTVKNRRRCQKCRYELCLQAGMRPHCVLDDGQKKQRFRKMIRKQKRQAKKGGSSGAEFQDQQDSMEGPGEGSTPERLVFPKRGGKGKKPKQEQPASVEIKEEEEDEEEEEQQQQSQQQDTCSSSMAAAINELFPDNHHSPLDSFNFSNHFLNSDTGSNSPPYQQHQGGESGNTSNLFPPLPNNPAIFFDELAMGTGGQVIKVEQQVSPRGYQHERHHRQQQQQQQPLALTRMPEEPFSASSLRRRRNSDGIQLHQQHQQQQQQLQLQRQHQRLLQLQQSNPRLDFGLEPRRNEVVEFGTSNWQQQPQDLARPRQQQQQPEFKMPPVPRLPPRRSSPSSTVTTGSLLSPPPSAPMTSSSLPHQRVVFTASPKAASPVFHEVIAPTTTNPHEDERMRPFILPQSPLTPVALSGSPESRMSPEALLASRPALPVDSPQSLISRKRHLLTHTVTHPIEDPDVSQDQPTNRIRPRIALQDPLAIPQAATEPARVKVVSEAIMGDRHRPENLEELESEDDDDDDQDDDNNNDALTDNLERPRVVSPYLDFEAEEAAPIALIAMPNSASLASGSSSSRFRRSQQRYTKGVERAWRFVLSKMLSDSSKEQAVVRSVVNCHLGFEALTKSGLREHFIRFARMLRHFAMLQPVFGELSKHDQRTLLWKNAPLFLQFVLAKYLTAQSPPEQVDWLVLGNHDRRSYSSLRLREVSFDRVNKDAGLFDDAKAAAKYWELCQELSARAAAIGRRSAPLVVLTSLFRTGFASHMDDADAADDHYSDVVNHARWAHETYGTASAETVESVVAVLADMAELFEKEVDWSEDDASAGRCLGYLEALKIELHPCYTNEEDLWLQRQFDCFSETFKNVSYGEDTLKAGLNYHQDGASATLDPSFGEKVLTTMRERFRRILFCHDEFVSDRNTTDQERLDIVHRGSNISDAVSLVMAKIERVDTGYDQFRLSLGDLDVGMLEGKHRNILEGGPAIVKVTLPQVNASIGALDQATIERFQELTARTYPKIRSAEDFKAAAMIVLCSPADPAGKRKIPSLEALQLRYMRHYASRKLAQGEEESVKGLEELVRDVKELSKILHQYMVNGQRIMQEMMMKQQQQQQQMMLTN